MTTKHALVRSPEKTFSKCISSHPQRHTIDVNRARSQHATYCNVLSELGVDVIHLPPDDEHPDACFVEDTAVIVGQKALIGRMAKASRRGESAAVEEQLKRYLSIKRVTAPGTLEGGDVIHFPMNLISGITQRTNVAGVIQMQDWFNVPITTIHDTEIIHLKSHVTYLNRNILVATRAYAHNPILDPFEVLVIPDNESYAANTLTINDTVLIPEGHPQTQRMIETTGFNTVALNISEFAKCEGALTCLSLLF